MHRQLGYETFIWTITCDFQFFLKIRNYTFNSYIKLQIKVPFLSHTTLHVYLLYMYSLCGGQFAPGKCWEVLRENNWL